MGGFGVPRPFAGGDGEGPASVDRGDPDHVGAASANPASEAGPRGQRRRSRLPKRPIRSRPSRRARARPRDPGRAELRSPRDGDPQHRRHDDASPRRDSALSMGHERVSVARARAHASPPRAVLGCAVRRSLPPGAGCDRAPSKPTARRRHDRDGRRRGGSERGGAGEPV